MEFQGVLPHYWEAFLRLFYPSICALCDRLLELQERGVCLSCRGKLQILKLLSSEERVRLPLSWGDEGWALFRYEGAMREILHQIKFERRRDLLQIFTQDLVLFLARRPQLASYDWLIPIPLDPRRRPERQFNLSGLLAEKIHEISRIPLRRRGLLKKRSTPPQSRLGREGRKLNLDRIFRVPRSRPIQAQSILVVDDIFTTGSTFEEAAKTLKAQGASRVGCLALARSFGH